MVTKNETEESLLNAFRSLADADKEYLIRLAWQWVALTKKFTRRVVR